MAQLEFITGNRVDGLKESDLYDFILDKVSNNRILVLEKHLNPIEQMQLLARGLERAKAGVFDGVKTVEISISSSSNGFLRKQKEIKFNLITTGSSIIDQKEEGIYSIKTDDNSNENIVAFT